ncbi:cytochrome P450 [Wilcoxina mikolae CBS 423.85]|nr:cytochrome P450 [Wilcoxina mikolae CBS 423.85]
MAVTVILVSLFALYLTHHFYRSYQARLLHSSFPACKPGIKIFDPFGLRRIRNVIKHVRQKRFLFYLGSVYKQYNRNTLPLPLPGMTGYITAEPENIRALMSTEFKNCGVSEGRAAYGYFLGPGFFIQDNEAWSRPRALLRPNFARAQVSDFTLLERMMQNLFAAIETHSGAFDIEPLFQSLTLDVATEFLLGDSADSLAGGEGALFSAALEKGLAHVNFAVSLGPVWWLWKPKAYRDSRNFLHAFVDRYVVRAITRAEEGRTKDGYHFLDALTAEMRDPEVLRAHVLNTLFAGRDTTASLLSWLMWNLVRNPEVMARVEQEIEAVVGDELPTAKLLEEMKYFKAVVNETLRLYSPVPLTNRESLRPLALPRGGGDDGASPLLIPANVTVMTDFFTMHRRRDIWGDDSEEFRPERWLETENLDREMTGAFKYLPFGGGPRSCLGQQLALNTAMYTIVRIVQRYAGFEKKEGDSDEVLFTSTPVPAPGAGVWITMDEKRV